MDESLFEVLPRTAARDDAGRVTVGGCALADVAVEYGTPVFAFDEQGLPVRVAYPKPPKMSGILGELTSNLGLKQFRCAETEKFPHVTFFFNDYREAPFAGEDRLLAYCHPHGSEVEWVA